jgi:hypothetical protein
VRGPKHDATDGGPSLVRVVDGRGRPLGVATWAARPRLALRLVARAGQPEPTDLGALVDERLAAALARRRRWPGPRRLPRRRTPRAICCPAWSSIATPTRPSCRRRRWR